MEVLVPSNPGCVERIRLRSNRIVRPIFWVVHAITHQEVQQTKNWNQGLQLDGFSGDCRRYVSVAVVDSISEELVFSRVPHRRAILAWLHVEGSVRSRSNTNGSAWSNISILKRDWLENELKRRERICRILGVVQTCLRMIILGVACGVDQAATRRALYVVSKLSERSNATAFTFE